jgi:hypothetical protein
MSSRFPPAKRGGGKRRVAMRAVVNGVMYVLSTGCQWCHEKPRAIPSGLALLGRRGTKLRKGYKIARVSPILCVPFSLFFRLLRSRMLSLVCSGSLVGDLHFAPGSMRIEEDEQIGRPLAAVLAIVALRLAPFGWDRLADAADPASRHRGRARPPSGRHRRHPLGGMHHMSRR